MTSQTNIEQAEWKTEHENILAEWGDKAMCYKWLHQKSNQKFSRMNALFTIPVIIISTITGTANFAQDKFTGSTREMVVVIIGSFNILAGIIQTIHQFLKISEYNEAHRVSCIAWDKFYRNIKVELAKSPSERVQVGNMLKLCKDEFDRLTETSPNIHEGIIKAFMATGKGNSETFKQISKPEICGELVSTNTFRYIEKVQIQLPKNVDTRHKSIEKSILKKFILDFSKVRGRTPTLQEIQDNLQDDKISLEPSEIETLVNNLTNISVISQDPETNISTGLNPNTVPDAEAIEMVDVTITKDVPDVIGVGS